MERHEQIRVLKEIIRRLDEGTNVDAGGIRRNPTWVYTCPDLAKREWETFYRSYPQYASYPIPDDRYSNGWYYAMNQMGEGTVGDDRAHAILRGCYASLPG